MTAAASDEGGPDVPRLLSALARHGVEFILVGGVAAQAHGATRPTRDVDCLVRQTAENLDSVAAAMRELRARLHVEGLSDEEAMLLPIQLEGAWLARMEISTWRTDAGDFDLLADMPDRDGRHIGYDELADRAAVIHHLGITVLVAALEDIIASKEWADRPKDQEALPELRRLRDAAGDP